MINRSHLQYSRGGCWWDFALGRAQWKCPFAGTDDRCPSFISKDTNVSSVFDNTANFQAHCALHKQQLQNATDRNLNTSLPSAARRPPATSAVAFSPHFNTTSGASARPAQVPGATLSFDEPQLSASECVASGKTCALVGLKPSTDSRYLTIHATAHGNHQRYLLARNDM